MTTDPDLKGKVMVIIKVNEALKYPEQQLLKNILFNAVEALEEKVSPLRREMQDLFGQLLPIASNLSGPASHGSTGHVEDTREPINVLELHKTTIRLLEAASGMNSPFSKNASEMMRNLKVVEPHLLSSPFSDMQSSSNECVNEVTSHTGRIASMKKRPDGIMLQYSSESSDDEPNKSDNNPTRIQNPVKSKRIKPSKRNRKKRSSAKKEPSEGAVEAAPEPDTQPPSPQSDASPPEIVPDQPVASVTSDSALSEAPIFREPPASNFASDSNHSDAYIPDSLNLSDLSLDSSGLLESPLTFGPLPTNRANEGKFPSSVSSSDDALFPLTSKAKTRSKPGPVPFNQKPSVQIERAYSSSSDNAKRSAEKKKKEWFPVQFQDFGCPSESDQSDQEFGEFATVRYKRRSDRYVRLIEMLKVSHPFLLLKAEFTSMCARPDISIQELHRADNRRACYERVKDELSKTFEIRSLSQIDDIFVYVDERNKVVHYADWYLEEDFETVPGQYKAIFKTLANNRHNFTQKIKSSAL